MAKFYTEKEPLLWNIFVPLQPHYIYDIGHLSTNTNNDTNKDMNILELSEQEIVRRNNLQQLRDLGIDPYPAAEYPTNAFSTEIKESFTDLPVDEAAEPDADGNLPRTPFCSNL